PHRGRQPRHAGRAPVPRQRAQRGVTPRDVHRPHRPYRLGRRRAVQVRRRQPRIRATAAAASRTTPIAFNRPDGSSFDFDDGAALWPRNELVTVADAVVVVTAAVVVVVSPVSVVVVSGVSVPTVVSVVPPVVAVV